MLAPVPAQSAPPGDAAELALLDDPAELARYTRWLGEGEGRRAQSAFVLGGMHCAACSGLIEGALARVAGVERVQVSAASQRATVDWDPQQARAADLVRAVRAAGYEAVPDVAASARELRQREHRTALWRLFVASLCAMQVMMLATPSYVSVPGELPADLRQLLNWGSWMLTVPVLVFSATPFFSGAWQALRRRRINMDVPVTLGVVVAFVASSGATFAPGGAFGHEVYFDSLTMFVAFLLGARFLEMSARHRAAQALESSMGAMPQVARRVGIDGRVEDVSPAALRVGDVVLVALGCAFPADGLLLEATTQADESLLTGESGPVFKRCGDELVGGAVNLGAPVRMRVTRAGGDTQLDQIVALTRDALSQRPAVARWADAWAAPFLWVVLALAGAAALVWGVVDPSRAVAVTVAVLIVTCPCALSLAAPAALVAATGNLARRGVRLRRLDALQALAQVRTVCFDKTGTLTGAFPAFSRAFTPGGAPAPDAEVAAAQALAQWSRHPLAQSLAQAELGLAPAGASWQQVRELPGAGLEALDAQGRRWRLGSRAWVAGEAHAPGPPPGPALSQVWFGPPGEARVGFEFDEWVRADAPQSVRRLQEAGLQVVLLSGDTPARALALAQRLGIAQVQGGATPADKLAFVQAAQARGERVAMVGDGVNDAPVLARADVSFAMGQGALVARAQADAIVVSGRLLDVAHAHAVARRVMAVVRQNLIWAALYNLACVPLALAGYMPPWAAGLGMAASSLLVVGNAARLFWWRGGG